MIAAFIIGLAIAGMADKKNEERKKYNIRIAKEKRKIDANYHHGLNTFLNAIHVGNESSVKNHITFRRLLRKSLVLYKTAISYLTNAEYYRVKSNEESNLFRKIHTFYTLDSRFPQTMNFHISDKLNKIILFMDYNQYRVGAFVLIKHNICGALLKHVFTFIPKKV